MSSMSDQTMPPPNNKSTEQHPMPPSSTGNISQLSDSPAADNWNNVWKDCVRQLRSGVLEEVERLGGEGAAEMSDLQEKEERLQLQLTCLLEDIQAFKNTALAKVESLLQSLVAAVDNVKK